MATIDVLIINDATEKPQRAVSIHFLPEGVNWRERDGNLIKYIEEELGFPDADFVFYLDSPGSGLINEDFYFEVQSFDANYNRVQG